jgi:hypothetical protein
MVLRETTTAAAAAAAVRLMVWKDNLVSDLRVCGKFTPTGIFRKGRVGRMADHPPLMAG